MNIIERMKAIKLSQNSLVLELAKYGIRTNPSELSISLRGILATPKAKRILLASEEIVLKKEKIILRGQK
ncbi:MAG: hypothetical protein ACTTIO_04245 [Candidatus Fimenecus sp.]